MYVGTDLTVANNIAVTGTVDGRDIATDGTKLDTVETNADVTDTTNVTSAGALMTTGGTITGNVAHGDNVQATFGDDGDFQIYHSGSSSIVRESSTGNLLLAGNDVNITNGAMNATHIDCNNGGSVELYHNNNFKFSTLSDGARVVGNLTISGTVDGVDIATRDGVLTSTTTTANAALPKTGGTMTGDLDVQATITSDQLIMGDNQKVRLGNAGDLEIYHNGTDNYIYSNNKTLRVQGNGSPIKLSPVNADLSAEFKPNGAVDLYHNAVKKFETSATGATLTGNLALTGTVDGRDVATDGSKLDGIESSANVTDTANVTSAGALMDSEIASLASVKAINQGLSSTSSPTFADLTISSAYPDFTIIDSDAGYTAKMLFQQVGGGSILKTFSHSNDGEFIIMGGASSTEHFKVNSSGHITVSGTVDGRDLASDGSKLDGIASGANNITNNNQLTNGAGYITSFTNTTYSAGTGMSLSGTTFNCTIDSPSEVGLGNLSSSGNSLSGSFTASGNITAYSSRKLKSDIKTIDNALDKVSQMRGVTFTKDGELSSGVIAEEFEEVAPELVQDGEYKSVAYGNTVGYLIEAIKELKAEVEELKSKKNCECE
jgi:hypothetical protein